MRKFLFLDRDGCLIEEPADQQVDSYAKLALKPGVIGALRRCVESGYELVLVSNQDGLGTPNFAREAFEGPHRLLRQILASEGIGFHQELVDTSFPEDGLDTRKPGVGLVRHYLADDGWSRAASAMVGDRPTDMEFAANLGVRGFHIGRDSVDWAAIAHALCDAARIAETRRSTKETDIKVRVDLDSTAEPDVQTGIGFFDHMLEQFGKHGGFSLALTCRGDTGVDDHHSIEDCALALGTALRQALGDKRGIDRYGFCLPMDDALANAALDLSGRPWFHFEGRFPEPHVGDMATTMVPHFFRSLCQELGANLHLSVRGDNAHHMVEACFKVTARALRQAIARNGTSLPSTKGAL